jgi:hypothetical protein
MLPVAMISKGMPSRSENREGMADGCFRLGSEFFSSKGVDIRQQERACSGPMDSRTINRHSSISAQSRVEGVILAASRQKSVVLALVLVISILLLSGTGSGYV